MEIDGAIRLEPSAIFDGALAGITYNSEHEAILVYDYGKIAECLADDYEKAEGGITRDEAYAMAEEFIDYNTLRAIPYMGPRRPMIIYTDDTEWLVELLEEGDIDP